VQIFFDESGDYGFPVDRFDCYAQAALICPEQALASASDFVRGRCDVWGLEELHAHLLAPRQLLEVVEFLVTLPIELCAQVTDTTLTTRSVIQSWRLDQAAAYERSITKYRRGGGADAAVVTDLSARIKQAGLETQISVGEFVHATLLVDGTVQAIQRALYAFGADEWRPAFHEFRFVIDGKLPGKRSAGEKYLSSMIVPLIAGSPRNRFDRRPDWSDDPVHPWVARFSSDGRVNLDDLFERGLEFASSDQHAGLQLADAVAYVVRRAVVSPTAEIMRSYRLLTRRLADRAGCCLVIARPPSGTRDHRALLRYQAVATAAPRNELGGPAE
jgi:hypothetical protein